MSGGPIMSRSKQKGTSFETVLVNYLIERGIDARRLPLSGSKDQGDVWSDLGVSFEAKNCRAMSLAAWVDEARVETENAGRPVVVFHKRVGKGNPGESYVTMTLDQFLALLRPASPAQSGTVGGVAR